MIGQRYMPKAEDLEKELGLLENLREALREELHGIRWVCYGRAHLETRKPPQILGHPSSIDLTPNGFVVAEHICDKNGVLHGHVFEVDRNYRILWEKLDLVGPGEYPSVCYNWKTGKVLIGDAYNGVVKEYDPGTDRVTLELTEFKGVGKFRHPRATYVWKNMPETNGPPAIEYEENEIWVADYGAHYVARLDRDGNVLDSLGTYGTPGSGRNLREPWFATGTRINCYIADRVNHRAFIYNFAADKFYILWAYPMVQEFRVMFGSMYVVTSAVYPTFVGRYPDRFMAPFGFRSSAVWTDLNTLVMTDHVHIYEFDTSFLTGRKPNELVWPSYANYTMGAGSSLGKHVIVPSFWNEVVIQALSTQRATLKLYSLKQIASPWLGDPTNPLEAEPDADGNLQWEEYDSVLLRPNKLEVYPIEDPPGCMAIDIEMGDADGAIDLRVLHR